MNTAIKNISASTNFTIDTLTFSKNMQKAGMSQRLSEQLANNLKHMQFGFIETLLTKDEFRVFQKEVNLEIKDLRKDMKDLQKDMHDFKDEIRNDMQEFQREIKGDMQEFQKEIRGEIENLVSKKEFYSEMKNLSLSLTIKLGVIMGAGIGVIGILTKF